MLRKLWVLFISLTITAFSLSAVHALDAPHNDSNNMNCGSCHGSALLSSPFWGATPDDTTYNNLCLLNCHNAASNPYTDTSAPAVKTHSSANTTTTYGTWGFSCIACHDPHTQYQKMWKNSDASELFLASGQTALPVPVYNGGTNTVLLQSESENSVA